MSKFFVLHNIYIFNNILNYGIMLLLMNVNDLYICIILYEEDDLWKMIL